jgi:hypothetical protein
MVETCAPLIDDGHLICLRFSRRTVLMRFGGSWPAMACRNIRQTGIPSIIERSFDSGADLRFQHHPNVTQGRMLLKNSYATALRGRAGCPVHPTLALLKPFPVIETSQLE